MKLNKKQDVAFERKLNALSDEAYDLYKLLRTYYHVGKAGALRTALKRDIEVYNANYNKVYFWKDRKEEE